MTTPTRPRLTVDEFLALPEEKPYRELWDGEIVEKAPAGLKHSRVVVNVILELGLWLRAHPIAWLDTELRHHEEETGWVFLPDVSVTLASRRAEEVADPVTVMPDFVVEVTSEGDRPGRVAAKVARYQRAGVTLAWQIDPEDRSVTVYERGKDLRVLMAGDIIDGGPVLPGFEIEVAQLFRP